MNQPQPGHVSQSTNAEKSMKQRSLKIAQTGPLDDGVAEMKTFMEGAIFMDNKNPPISSFSELKRMELTFSSLASRSWIQLFMQTPKTNPFRSRSVLRDSLSRGKVFMRLKTE